MPTTGSPNPGHGPRKPPSLTGGVPNSGGINFVKRIVKPIPSPQFYVPFCKIKWFQCEISTKFGVGLLMGPLLPAKTMKWSTPHGDLKKLGYLGTWPAHAVCPRGPSFSGN
ncbi:hypothetical protein JTE90_025380 [Oedothorax gibbosus]|uniref:Uncharacterized protein n=1 Tax=Oedothorax gibbosus TaxID=931172 RepID=A0AAV6TQ05_9ARAC|nr:hypothetical protein JTE90_025380 [Oedothorax gibbosus]